MIQENELLSENAIERGRRVRLHFSLRLKDGTIADSSLGGEPAEWVIGDGALIEGLENLLLGMRAGDKRSFEVAAGEAYGAIREEVVHSLPRDAFPADMALEPGLVIGFETPSGEEIPGTIVGLDDDAVQVDFSHPLAGHDLIFEVEILEVGAPD
ncbi:MAG TPA: peptidylprolyl isomerase [Acidiferrobacterales bacterium]